jgi:TetR/AcrR family transcriptional regulator, cholesterol catabolism regulator
MSVGVVGRCMASAAKRPAGLAVKRDVAQRKERASYAAKRKKIVKAAGSVLKQCGLGGTTIGAIAKEAGLGRATIYYYFADKGAIFGEVIHGGLAEMVAALEEVAASGDSPEVQLRSSIRVVMRAFEQHYPQLYVFSRRIRHPSLTANCTRRLSPRDDAMRIYSTWLSATG